MSEWISVKENLPNEIEIVLIFFGNNIDFGYLSDDKWELVSHLNQEINPTHWMPLPEPPKEQS